MIQLMTEDELNEVGQMVQRVLPADTTWIMVMIPPHEADEHQPGKYPVQTTTNIASTEHMRGVLDGAAKMFEEGTHVLLFAHPVEKAD
jgi:hypothetical protein